MVYIRTSDAFSDFNASIPSGSRPPTWPSSSCRSTSSASYTSRNFSRSPFSAMTFVVSYSWMSAGVTLASEAASLRRSLEHHRL